MRSGAFRQSSAAIAFGCRTIVRALHVPLLLYFSTLVAALPFAVMVGAGLRQSLDRSIPPQEAYEVDATWWAEYAQHATGMERSFLPHIIGAAAPLQNLSNMLEGWTQPWIVAPLAVYVILASWVWARALPNFIRRINPAMAEPRRPFLRLFTLNVLATALMFALYAVMHPLLFDVLALPRPAASLVFALLLIAATLTADYSRVMTVALDERPLHKVISETVMRMRQRWMTVLLTFAAAGTALLLIIGGYAVLDTFGGSRVGGWRLVLLAQMYLVGRVVLRAITVAAQVRVILHE